MPTYADISLSFNKHPGTKDITKVYDVEAVKQAIRNIFLYNRFEKPFDPDFGLNIREYLFEPNSPGLNAVVKRQINNQLQQYEPRCSVDEVKIESDDLHTLSIELKFHVVGFNAAQTVTISVARTR